jgi:hypothetical protein
MASHLIPPSAPNVRTPSPAVSVTNGEEPFPKAILLPEMVSEIRQCCSRELKNWEVAAEQSCELAWFARLTLFACFCCSQPGDAFTLSAWQEVCLAAGFEILTETMDAQRLQQGRFWLVLPLNYTLLQLERARSLYGNKKQQVRFVSSVVFTAAARSKEEGGPLGPFPESLMRFRSIFHGVQLCPTAVSQSTKKSLELWCSAMGGVFDGTYTKAVRTDNEIS